METARAMETVEKQNRVFPPFPPRLENSTKSVEFPTVSTAPTAGTNRNKKTANPKTRNDRLPRVLDTSDATFAGAKAQLLAEQGAGMNGSSNCR
jgi:hypothetical protein